MNIYIVTFLQYWAEAANSKVSGIIKSNQAQQRNKDIVLHFGFGSVFSFFIAIDILFLSSVFCLNFFFSSRSLLCLIFFFALFYLLLFSGDRTQGDCTAGGVVRCRAAFRGGRRAVYGRGAVWS